MRSLNIVEMLSRDRHFAELSLQQLQHSYTTKQHLLTSLMERLVREFQAAEKIRAELVYPACGIPRDGVKLPSRSLALRRMKRSTVPLRLLQVIQQYLDDRRIEETTLIIPRLKSNQSREALKDLGRAFAAMQRRLVDPM